MDFYYKNEAEQFTFYRLPKLLFTDDNFKDLPCEAKLIYGLMLDRMGLSVKNNWVDNFNRVYIIFKNDEIAKMINCSVKKVINLLDELENYGLIQTKRLGLGKPNLIFIKNFTTVDDVKNVKESRDIKKDDYINAENGSYYIDTKVKVEKKPEINVEQITEVKVEKEIKVEQITKEKIENYRKILKENISYDDLVLTNEENIDRINEILEIMLETILSKSKYIRIAKNEVATEIVKNILLKVNYSHIEYILLSLSKTTSKITNIKSYLLTTIYNSVLTKENYYSQLVNNDLYGKENCYNSNDKYNIDNKPLDKFVNYKQPKLDFKKLREYEIKSLFFNSKFSKSIFEIDFSVLERVFKLCLVFNLGNLEEFTAKNLTVLAKLFKVTFEASIVIFASF